VDELFRRTAANCGYEVTADLEKCTLTDAHGLAIPFNVEPFRRHCLLHGLDDIGLTLEHEAKIAAYEQAHGIAS
jgi:3-isopropylmalate/(R)-2-methylmalate dehydratase small subunit